MPIYTYTVVDEHGLPTGETVDRIYRWEDRPEEITSSQGRRAVYRLAANAPARMASQWSSAAGTQRGVNGTINRGLGGRFHSVEEERAYAESRGLAPVSDFDTHFIDDQIETSKALGAEQDRAIERYRSSTAHLTETWS